MEGKTQETAAAQAGMNVRSARKWQSGLLPSATKPEHRWRTQPDPFDGVWEDEIEPLLRGDPAGKLKATTIIDWLEEQYPGRFSAARLRTQQRRLQVSMAEACWATVSTPFTASSATLALKAGLCFPRPIDISPSFPTATAALGLGAGLSLSYLSDFPGPPHHLHPRRFVPFTSDGRQHDRHSSLRSKCIGSSFC